MTFLSKPLAISAAVASVFLSSTNAFAADAENEISEVIVTAGRQPQLAKDVLADNVIITKEEIAKSGASSIVELLQKQRGIEITRNGGAGSVSSVLIRGGSNAQSVVYIDGVRIGSATTGGATWSAIPVSQIERIEVVYGPLSSLYGADAMGGVIQVFTKKGSHQLAPTASLAVGSYGMRKAEAGISGATENNLSFALNLAHETADGFSVSKPAAGPYTYDADNDGYTLQSASGRLAWDVTKDTAIGANFLHSNVQSQFDSGPGYDARGEQKLSTVALFAKTKITSNWSSALQLAQTADKGFSDASYGKSQIDTMQKSINFQNDFVFDKNVLQIIAERRIENVEATSLKFAPSRSTNSIAAAYVFKQDAHLATVSVRMDDSSQYGKHNTGNLAYGYKLSDAWRVNASYGTSFRAPTYNELYYPNFGNPANKPEQAKNKEAGVFYDDNTVQFSAVYYQNKAEDLLVSASPCPLTPNSPKTSCSYNVNRATMSGLSMAASTSIGDLTLRAALDIQKAIDDTTGKRLVRRAKQHGTLTAEYSLNQAKIGVETVFADARFENPLNTVTLPGYALLNLYASYDFAGNWSALARWNNALNKDYELAKNYTVAGSNVYLGLKYGFK